MSIELEFNEKLQQLRKQKDLTQEQLAEQLYVSRTAISKWESGKGYPNIESLKCLAKLFSVSIDELLSNEELITLCYNSYIFVAYDETIYFDEAIPNKEILLKGLIITSDTKRVRAIFDCDDRYLVSFDLWIDNKIDYAERMAIVFVSVIGFLATSQYLKRRK